MELINVKIKGYKSINELELPIKKYGEEKSYTSIFLGKNEAGKSNVLEALATPKLANQKKMDSFLDISNQQTQGKSVSIIFTYTLNKHEIQSILKGFPEDVIEKMDINTIEKEVYLTSHKNSHWREKYSIVNSVDSLNSYNFNVSNSTLSKMEIAKKFVYTPFEKSSEVDYYEPTNTKKLSKETFPNKELSKIPMKTFITVLEEKMKSDNFINTPIDIWRNKPEYLINETIYLEEFIPSMNNIPLKHMFFLAGYSTKKDIINIIEKLYEDSRIRRILAKKLSKATTNYLNKKWPEQKIEIDVSIEKDLTLEVHVKDKSDEMSYFKMKDRSEGFQQFISLLLSLSISSTSGEVKNHLILIDEPEVHLHPSAVRWMLSELLEIGKKNYLFITTHSNFMIDFKTKERHFLLHKNKKNITEARQIKTEEDIKDDEILETAFGINVIRDFLTPHKLLVEGASDKVLLNKALSQVNGNHDVIITNGNGANLNSISASMAFHDVYPLIITDADEAGEKIKDGIIKCNAEFANKVFTIKDLLSDIILGGTIEDTLPINFVRARVNNILQSYDIQEVTMIENEPVIKQIKNHLNRHVQADEENKKGSKIKYILDTIKKELSEYDKKSISEEKTPILFKLATEILNKFSIESK